MNTDFGIRIDTSGSGRHGHEPHNGNGSRRQQHQQKLKALIQALDLGNLDKARQAYAALLDFSPALEHSNFSRVGEALRHGNLALARQVIEDIYGQSQAIFRRSANARPAHAIAATVIASGRPLVDVLTDFSA